MSELRPCPWCGEEITLSRALHDSNLCLIKCRKCKVDMGTDYSQRLFHAWNTRPIEDALNAQIKDQEATIDALLTQNQTQMLELEKLEAKIEALQEWCEQEIKETKNFNSINGIMREILKSRYLRANDLLDKFCRVKK